MPDKDYLDIPFLSEEDIEDLQEEGKPFPSSFRAICPECGIERAYVNGASLWPEGACVPPDYFPDRCEKCGGLIDE